MSTEDPRSTNKDEASTGYRVLARKYRPKDFNDLMVGQEPMVKTLTNAFETGRIAQAYMLTGVRGVGKTTTARILARALNYKTPTIDKPTIDLKEPGEHCQAIMDGRHVDVIEMDAASHTGIDDIREIIEQVRYRPVSARYKVYIIDEVHMLSTQAFNGLLKTLEEPPEHVKFIFATTEIRKVPITVLSRCQRFDLRRISASDLVGLFSTIAGKEGIEAEPEALSMIARAAEGSARDGLSLMDQAIAHGAGVIEAETVRTMLGLADRARVTDLFGLLVKGDGAGALDEFESQYAAGANPVAVLNDLADFTHLVTRIKYIPEAADDPAISEAERTKGAEFANSVAVTTLSRIWQMLLKGIPETETSSRPASAAEMVLIRIAHASSLPSPEDAARRVAELADGAPAAPAPNRPSAPNGGAQAYAVNGTTGVSTNAMGAPAPTNAPKAMLRSVPKPEASPEQDAKLEMGKADAQPAPEPLVPVRSLEDIADLCSKNRDPKLKAQLRQFVHLVKLEPGKLEISLAKDSPRSLVNDLKSRLEDWTGIKWWVTLSRESGAPTLAQAEATERENNIVDAKADPDVAAILEKFPGAKIMDVRINRRDALPDTEEAPMPSAVESDEGDILPGDDIDF
ncbi:DNA polymerase III subunit gamma/tau [Rhizobium sp. L1K21]|uniref:DNA polymerase III subunit gamma/tau n=1 Tax=Rhizobium sp. L1K21 TaxID=2954933 RepID=UPI0020925AEE|nr:DNA polymerase III subunit gamma/tau [Rhizobium sp. L1K21]MCO6187405.1 DNA polymerase III subunit gamma/tau [Rhizobium sp. L1K21]